MGMACPQVSQVVDTLRAFEEYLFTDRSITFYSSQWHWLALKTLIDDTHHSTHDVKVAMQPT